MAENCPVPSNAKAFRVVGSIVESVTEHGKIDSFNAYLRFTEEQLSRKATWIRSQLQFSGVSLIDCPLNGRKDVVDHMIMVDMVMHAMQHPGSTIALITGDRDFAYAMAKIKLQGHKIVLITKSDAHVSIREPADICLDWQEEILGMYKQEAVLMCGSMEYIDEDEVDDCEDDSSDNYASDSDHIWEETEDPKFAASVSIDIYNRVFATPPPSPPRRSYERHTSPKSSIQSVMQSPTMPDINSLTLSSPIYKGRSTYETMVDLPTSSNFRPREYSDSDYSTFEVLIDCLREHAANIIYRPLRSLIGSQISRNGATYRAAGVRGFAEYTALAEKEGIVSLGGLNGLAWISLKPAWR